MLSKILSMFYRRPIERISFDYSSIAGRVFEDAVFKGKKVAVIGSRKTEMDTFERLFMERYSPDLRNLYFHHGYLSEDEFVRDFGFLSEFDLIVIGMGAVRQERFMLRLLDMGFEGVAYTCGGFVHQTASSGGNYYPVFYDKYNLRWLYRMLHEKGLSKRYMLEYPADILKISYGLLRGKIKIKIEML